MTERPVTVLHEPRFAVVFDLPDQDGHLTGDPYYAGAVYWNGNPVPAFFANLADAARFQSEDQAAGFLRLRFSPQLQEFGVVVEIVEEVAS